MKNLLLILNCFWLPILAGADDQITTTWPDEVLEIHNSGMLFDGHNDLPWQMREKGSSSFDKVDISKPTKFHTDIPRLRKGGVKAQFWSVYVPASTDFTGNALIQTLEQIAIVKDMCQRYPDTFELALGVDDIERITDAGKIASLIGVEGGHSIQNSLQALRQLYAEGARYMTLTHSKTLAWADSCTDDAKNNGLSPFGKDVVREMNRLGMLVDISHVSPKCMKDALEISRAPIIFSHSSARAVCDHVRNVPDDVLELTKQNGGVVMITFVPSFVVPKSTENPDKVALGSVKTVVDHIEHVINKIGIDHVGIGSDFDGVSNLPVGLKDVSQYPNITQELIKRGYRKEDIHKILGSNVMRVFRNAEKIAKQLKANTIQNDSKTKKVVVVENGDQARGPSVVSVELTKEFMTESKVVTLSDGRGNQLIGQISAPEFRQLTKNEKQVLTFVVPKIAANEKIEFEFRESGLNAHRSFEWHDDGSTQAELQYGKSPVLRYMYEEVDDSSKKRREETYKPYHHAFSPDGKTLLTKGPGGLFPHHRGIYFGYNRISYDDKKADTWHCRNGESQVHSGSVMKVAGPVFGRDINLILWNGQDGKPFAKEVRQVTAYKIAGNILVDFEADLKSLVSKISLKGDPQHAGVQFRATQKVPDNTAKKTYYVRPDGKGKPGSFRNWSGKKNENEINKAHINLDWNMLNMFVDDQHYSICYLNHPQNPTPSRFSERDYGRFGCYFEHELMPEKPLTVKYRFWIQENELSIDMAKMLHNDFANPLMVELRQIDNTDRPKN